MSYGTRNAGCVLPEFTVDDLGASFKVVLINSVSCIEKEDGKEFYIPDYQGLIKQIAVSRAAHPAKLKSNDIRFLRRSLGLKSKEMAEKLDIGPEHFSRCEKGEKTLSPNSEKVLRILVVCEAVYVLQKAIEDVEGDRNILFQKVTKLLESLKRVMEGLKIQSVHLADEELVFRFQRIPLAGEVAANDDPGPMPPEWLDEAA